MAYDFDGLNDYLYANIGLDPPLTMAVWFNNDVVNSADTLMAVCRAATNGMYALECAGHVAGDPVRLHHQNDSGGNTTTDTTSGFTASQWYHACGIVESASASRVYIHGGSKTTRSGSITLPSTPARTSLGMAYLSSTFTPFNGKLALPAIWSAALTDEEVAALAAGAHPTTIRPAALTECWELDISGSDPGFLRAYPLVFPGGSLDPVWANVGVSIHRGRSPLVVLIPAATAPVDLVVADASFSVLFDSPTLAQVHELAAQDAFLPVAFDQVALTQVHQLTAQDATFPTTFDSPALTQLHELAVDDASLTTSFENVTLTQGQTLVVQDATLPVVFDSPALGQVHALTVADSALPVTFDSPVLTQAHQLAADDANIAVLFESPTLFQAHSLTAEDATFPTLFDSVTLTTSTHIDTVAVAVSMVMPSALLSTRNPASTVGVRSAGASVGDRE